MQRSAPALLFLVAFLVVLSTACGDDATTTSPPEMTPIAEPSPTSTVEPSATSSSVAAIEPKATPAAEATLSPEPTPTATSTPEPTPTVTPAPTTASRGTPGDGPGLEHAITEDTTWREVFDNSAASEQDCFSDNLGASLSAALESPVTENYWSEELLSLP